MAVQKSLAPLIERIRKAVAAYAAGEIPAGSLAPKYEQNCRYAPSFCLAKRWGYPSTRYVETTLRKYLGEKNPHAMKTALNLLAALEAGRISQEVFDNIVSGESRMLKEHLEALIKDF